MKTKTVFTFGIVAIFLAGGFYFFTGKNTTQEGASQKTNDRWISSIDSSEQQQIDSINKNIYDLRSKDQVLPLLENLQKIAGKKPDMQVVQLYNLVLSPIRHLEGFMWRARGFVEDACSPCHLMAIRAISGLYRNDHLYGPHLRAVIDFVVEPPKGNSIQQFDSISSVQNFLSTNLIPALEISLAKAQEVTQKTEPGDMFKLDTRILAGFDENKNIRFVSEKHRYKRVVQGNLHYVVSTLQRSLGLMYFAINYNLDDVPSFIDKIVKKTALTNVLTFKPKYNTALEYVAMTKRFPNVGKAKTTLAGDNLSKAKIQENLDKSFAYFLAEVQSRINGLAKSRNQAALSESNQYLITPKMLNLTYDETMRSLSSRDKMMKSAANNEAHTFISKVTSKSVSINPKALFTYHADLKAFLPDVKKIASSNKKRSIGSHNLASSKFKWNYNYGKMDGWKDATFAGLLPGATNANVKEIVRALKTTPYTKDIAQLLPAL